MRALTAAVIVMGVLIIAGVATVAVTIVSRVAEPATPVAAQAVLDEPVGTRIAGIAVTADHLAIQLQGGGPDRVVVLETHRGRMLARVTLTK